MLIEWIAFVGFALLLGLGSWWAWRQGQLARKQAEMDARLAELGRGVGAIAHDLDNLFCIISGNLHVMSEAPDDEHDEDLSAATVATGAAMKLVDAMQRHSGPGRRGRGSSEGLVRLTAALLRSCGTQIEIEVSGDLPYRGPDAEAARVVQNLLFNAAREVSAIEGAWVKVELSAAGLHVRNLVRDPSLLGQDIYDEGVSHTGSSGKGLAIVRRSAGLVGWTVRHEIDGQDVCFTVAPAAEPELAAQTH